MHPKIIDARLPDGVLGATDGTTIWLDTDLTRGERRCVLAHELAHVAAGDAGTCTSVIERRIDFAVARALITIEPLGHAAAWSPRLEVIAQELEVTPETVQNRLRTLTCREHADLTARLRDAWWD